MPKDSCQPIRDNINAVERDVRSTEDVITEVNGSAKKVLEEYVKREQLHLKQLRNALRACEANKK